MDCEPSRMNFSLPVRSMVKTEHAEIVHRSYKVSRPVEKVFAVAGGAPACEGLSQLQKQAAASKRRNLFVAVELEIISREKFMDGCLFQQSGVDGNQGKRQYKESQSGQAIAEVGVSRQ